MKPIVSVIFPSLNPAHEPIETLLRSIRKQRISSEIIMSLNGPNNSSIRKFTQQFSYLKIIYNRKNIGFSKAVNRAAQKSRGKYLFITNSDVSLEKNCLVNLVSYLETHPSVGIVGPISYLDKKHKNLDAGILRYTLMTGIFKTYPPRSSLNSDWVSGSGLLISRHLWKHLSGFDEEFFFYYEDVDLALRAKKMGYSIHCIPHAMIVHPRGTTAHDLQRHWFRYFNLHRSRQLLLIKHGSVAEIIIGLILQLCIFPIYHGIILNDHSFGPLLDATRVSFKLSNIRILLQARSRYHKWLHTINSQSLSLAKS